MFIFIAAMKRYLIILITCCGLFNRVCGQSPSAAIDSLIKYRIITAKQRPVLEKELREIPSASYRVAILAGVENIMLQKTFHIDPHKTGIMFSYRAEHLNKKSKDSINTSLRLLLEKINKAGLLTDRVYTYTLKGIDSSNYLAEIQMIGHLTEMSSRLEWLAPNKLLPVVEQLHKNGIVSDSSFLRLQNDIKSGKIESAFQLNDYCKLDRTIDLTKYADDPSVWLEQLHRDIASTMPGLNFTDFSYTATPDSNSSIEGIPGIKFKMSLICNGRVYKHTSVALNYRSRQGKVRATDMLPISFFRIFNKILADQQSPFRLHCVMFSYATRADDNLKNLALIALKGEQTEVFMKQPCLSYMLVSMENYDNTLTSGRVDSTIAEWRKIGLFAHLSEAEISKAIDNVEADDLFSINRLLFNFPQVIYSLDSALMSPRYPYGNLLSHLAGITHGAFIPTRITQTQVKGGVKLQYLFKGKIHSYTFNTANGWLDDKFPAFMKRISQENNLPSNFYQLPYENAIIYLTKQQYDYAVKHKLLDFGTKITDARR